MKIRMARTGASSIVSGLPKSGLVHAGRAPGALLRRGDGRVTFTWYVPLVLSASGEISRIEPVTAISGRPGARP